jgi:folate-binding protein YgfZ
MSAPDSYQAALDRAIIADRSPRGILELAGGDRQTLLHNLLTNDIAGLAPGTGCYAAYLTPQGRLITDMRVAVLRERVLLDVEPEVKDELRERLDQSIFAEEVRIADRSALAVLRVAGRDAPRTVTALLQGLVGADDGQVAGLPALAEYSSVEWASQDGPIVAVRDDSLGLPGYDLLLARGPAERVLQAARATQVTLAGAETLDVLRVEAGRPRFLADMDRDTIPLEAGIESRAISLTKGCYPGQEVIIRVLHRGHGRVARRLVGLVIEGDRVPRRGDPVMQGGRRLGAVTSAVRSPAVGKVVALGYVHREESDAGTEVTVESGGAPLAAVVAPLPFRR